MGLSGSSDHVVETVYFWDEIPLSRFLVWSQIMLLEVLSILDLADFILAQEAFDFTMSIPGLWFYLHRT